MTESTSGQATPSVTPVNDAPQVTAPTAQQETTTISSSPETASTKSGSKKMMIVLGLLLLLLLLLGLFFVLRPGNQVDNGNLTGTGTPTPTTGIQVSPTGSTVPTTTNGATPTKTTVNVNVELDEEVSSSTFIVKGSFQTSGGDGATTQSVSQSGATEVLTIKSGGFELTLSPAYEAEVVEYANYTKVNGAKIATLGRFYFAEDQTWTYVEDTIGSSCSYLLNTYDSPCGSSNLNQDGTNPYMFDVVCSGDIAECDAVMKTIEITKKS